MIDFLPLTAAFLAGGALGGFFFGGLWWTVRRVALSNRPALLVFGSLFLRTGVALAGLHLAGAGDLARLAACLLGFVLARLVVMRRTRPPAASAAATACAPSVPVEQAATSGGSPCA